MNRRCLGNCGRLIERGSYCAHCKQGNGWGKGRNRQKQATFRALVLAQDGYRCTYGTLRGEGERCDVRTITDLVAHHTEPGNDDPRKGRTLCTTHHARVDRHAR